MENKPRTGDSNHITREYFDSLLIEMRHIDGVIPDTTFKLYGETFSTPVMQAALSHLESCHPEGMTELARGAKAADCVMWAGMGDFEELARITKTGAKTIKIIKPYADNDLIMRKIEHAEKCGCIAVGMDLDHSFTGSGEYDVIHDLKMAGKSLNEVKKFVRATKLPFIIKGVLSEQDARKCIEAGISGIVVSHHHGIMDFAVPPLMILPKIAEVISGKMPIFVDCGVETGFDVFKALALGATAASAGRIMMGPLKDNGADGVVNKVREITAQLAGVMARTCAHNIAQIESSMIWKR
jgi:isopentenyl diphosphate isomerase/L-lactate dehydrogenase-like FMN-dependent dehydrogenase